MKKLFFIALFLTLYTLGFANSVEYAHWLKAEQNSFNAYKKSLDEEFTDTLKKDWESFQALYTQAPLKPKPTQTPLLQAKEPLAIELIKESPQVLLKEKEDPQLLSEDNKDNQGISKEEIKTNKNIKYLHFDFYSKKITLPYPLHSGFLLTSVSQESIGDYWRRISGVDYSLFLSHLQSYSKQYNLNDWAIYLLVHQAGMKIYTSSNMANLFTWYILTQLKYDVKVGYNASDIFLLSSVKQTLFQVAYLNLQGKKYYVLTPTGKIRSIGQVHTYTSLHAYAKNPLSFEFKAPLLLNTVFNHKALHFSYENQTHTLETKYSADLVDFYKTFPQSDYTIYFNTQNSSFIDDSLLLQLKRLLATKSEIEAVNMLLRFVQTAFNYQTDKEQFRYEKVFFPEETFFYPYSDCEDRTILFAYLVKHLLGLSVVGVKYSDHMSTAVKLSSSKKHPNLEGFVYKNSYYTLADPTYINANIGMSIPKYTNKKFDIIE